MEGKIIMAPSVTEPIQQLVKGPAEHILAFSLQKIQNLSKQIYFSEISWSYRLLKAHLYAVYEFLPEKKQPLTRDSLYTDLLREISHGVLSKSSVVSCRSIGEKFYSVPRDPSMIELYWREFNMISQRLRLPKKDDDSYQKIIKEALAKEYINCQEAEFLEFRLTANISYIHIVWQILQKMFQEYRVMGILTTMSENRQLQDIESNKIYDVPYVYIGKIYEVLVTDTFPDIIDKSKFINLVAASNFSEIWRIPNIKKAKLRHAIYCIGKQMSAGWYKLAAESIGSTPQQCSKGNVPLDWKRKIEGIKKE